MLRLRPVLHPFVMQPHLKKFSHKIPASAGGSSAVPSSPCESAPPHHDVTEPVTLHLVKLLEKLSLVDVANAEGVRSLNYTISMADRLRSVDTTGISPLIMLHEDRALRLSEDRVGNLGDTDTKRDAILACAADTLEDFYVVPPGNISYEPDENYHQNLISTAKST